MAESAPLLRVYRCLKPIEGSNPSLSASFFLAALFLAGLLLLTGCDRKESSQIQWQLPLEAPEDPHGVQQDERALPEWAASAVGDATLVWLEKSTARLTPIMVAMNEQATWHGWNVRLLGLANGLRLQTGAYIDDENVHNPAAFVEVSRNGAVVYRGWLYQEFPELFGPDDPDWKLWLKAISVQPPAEEETEGKNMLP